VEIIDDLNYSLSEKDSFVKVAEYATQVDALPDKATYTPPPEDDLGSGFDIVSKGSERSGRGS